MVSQSWQTLGRHTSCYWILCRWAGRGCLQLSGHQSAEEQLTAVWEKLRLLRCKLPPMLPRFVQLLLESGGAAMEVGLAGEYPVTEVILRFGEHERRHAIWNFDETSPDDPWTLDRAFTLYRIANLASWG